MNGFLCKLRQNRIGERYSLTKKIGEGGCGAVYIGTSSAEHFTPRIDRRLGYDHATQQHVALKLEHQTHGEALREEADFYECFQGRPGFPEIYWSGEKDDYFIMAFELLGPSLEDLFAYCDRRFTLKTTLMIADQLLTRLKAVHSAELVHRDVKPSNFLMGSGENGNVVYATDFGIALQYDTRLLDTVEESVTRHRRVVGTTRFASLSAHKGQGSLHQAQTFKSS